MVDNGSTDDSVERICEAYPQLTLLETGKNLGFAGGQQRGHPPCIGAGGADYVWLLNNDTIVEANTLSALVATAEANPRIGAVGSVLYYMDQPERVQAWGGGWVKMLLGVTRLHQTPVPAEKLDYLSGASVLVRTKASVKNYTLLASKHPAFFKETRIFGATRFLGYLSPRVLGFLSRMISRILNSRGLGYKVQYVVLQFGKAVWLTSELKTQGLVGRPRCER